MSVERLKWAAAGGYYLVTPKDSEGRDTIGGLRFTRPLPDNSTKPIFEEVNECMQELIKQHPHLDNCHILKAKAEVFRDQNITVYTYSVCVNGYFEFIAET